MSVVPFKQSVAGRLIQLPNKDLWRGRAADVVNDERADTFELDAVQGNDRKAEEIVLQVFTEQKGETVACVWCGQTFTRGQFNEFVEHVDKQHSRATKPLAAVEAKEAFDLSNSQIVASIELDPL